MKWTCNTALHLSALVCAHAAKCATEVLAWPPQLSPEQHAPFSVVQRVESELKLQLPVVRDEAVEADALHAPLRRRCSARVMTPERSQEERTLTFQDQALPYLAGRARPPLAIESCSAGRWEKPLQLWRSELSPRTQLPGFKRGLPDASLLEPLPPRATCREQHVQAIRADEARDVAHDLSREIRVLFHAQSTDRLNELQPG